MNPLMILAALCCTTSAFSQKEYSDTCLVVRGVAPAQATIELRDFVARANYRGPATYKWSAKEFIWDHRARIANPRRHMHHSELVFTVRALLDTNRVTFIVSDVYVDYRSSREIPPVPLAELLPDLREQVGLLRVALVAKLGMKAEATF